jgi:hypothetical protein
MAVAFVAAGSIAVGSTTVNVPYPAGLVANRMLIVSVANKYPTNGPTTPAGWTLLATGQKQGGHGSSGIDTGQVYITVFQRIADGTESGTLAISIPSGNSAVAVMVMYSVGASSTWGTSARNAAENTPGTAWSAVTGSDLNVTVGDLVLLASGINTDNYSASAETISCAGATFGTCNERFDSGTITGDNCGLVVADALVTAGTSSGVQTYAMTMSGSAVDAPAGATIFLRIREIPVNQPVKISYEATWDKANDWTGWTNDLPAADITVSRVTSPANPWIGACGRMQTTWTGGAGSYSFHFTPPASSLLITSRTHRVTMAMLISQMEFAGTRSGPIRVNARDDTGTPLSEVYALAVTPSAGMLKLQLTNALNVEFSTNYVDLRRFINEWLVYDFYVSSSTAAGVYTTTCWCDVWVYRAGRQKFLTRLSVSDYVGTPYDFNDMRIGFTLLSKGVDAFDVQIDEFRWDNNGGGLVLPRSPAQLRSYEAYARIRRWDKATSTWKSVLDIDRRAIKSISCAFLSFRVEDRCEIVMNDPGRYTDAKVQDVLLDMETNPKSLYRLDVYAPDANYSNPQYPSSWPNDFIFWSGMLVRREQDRAQQTRGVTIAAVGWTDYLRRIAITKKLYFKQTVNTILTDLMTVISAAWPGASISAVTRSIGLDSRLVIPITRFDVNNAYDSISALAQTGNFFFGVSVSGWPSYETQSAFEFRLVFFEPHANLDVTALSVGLAEENAIFLDINGDKHVTACKPLFDDSKYANQWVISGADLMIDLLSVVSGNDRDQIRDSYAYSNPSGESGANKFEAGFNGFELTLVDRARREINYAYKKTGDIYPAGRIEDLPTSLQVINGDSVWVIVTFTEGSGSVNYILGNFPASVENLTLDISKDVIRYKLSPGDARVLRTIIDNEDQTARETLSEFIVDARVRGYQLAGMLALESRYAERRNAEQVKLNLRGWMRTPNGSRNQQDNLISLSFGSEQMTILGTTGSGGDGWKYGDDARPVGNGRTYEIRNVTMVLGEGGWDCEYSLGSAPRDLIATLPPDKGPQVLLAGPPGLYEPTFNLNHVPDQFGG